MTFVDVLLEIFSFLFMGIFVFFCVSCANFAIWFSDAVVYLFQKRYPKFRLLFPSRLRFPKNEEEES